MWLQFYTCGEDDIGPGAEHSHPDQRAGPPGNERRSVNSYIGVGRDGYQEHGGAPCH